MRAELLENRDIIEGAVTGDELTKGEQIRCFLVPFAASLCCVSLGGINSILFVESERGAGLREPGWLVTYHVATLIVDKVFLLQF
jgi:hypothetical protein